MISAKALLVAIMNSIAATDPQMDTSKIDINEAYCLAQNVFYESRSEPQAGQFAVANVTLNRANHPQYPDTICEVVKYKYKNVCAFSWYCERGNKDPLAGVTNLRIIEQFEHASTVAILSLANELPDNTKGATHFHNTLVKPSWRYQLTNTGRIGNHIFYRSK